MVKVMIENERDEMVSGGWRYHCQEQENPLVQSLSLCNLQSTKGMHLLFTLRKGLTINAAPEDTSEWFNNSLNGVNDAGRPAGRIV